MVLTTWVVKGWQVCSATFLAIFRIKSAIGPKFGSLGSTYISFFDDFQVKYVREFNIISNLCYNSANFFKNC